MDTVEACVFDFYERSDKLSVHLDAHIFFQK